MIAQQRQLGCACRSLASPASPTGASLADWRDLLPHSGAELAINTLEAFWASLWNKEGYHYRVAIDTIHQALEYEHCSTWDQFWSFGSCYISKDQVAAVLNCYLTLAGDGTIPEWDETWSPHDPRWPATFDAMQNCSAQTRLAIRDVLHKLWELSWSGAIPTLSILRPRSTEAWTDVRNNTPDKYQTKVGGFDLSLDSIVDTVLQTVKWAGIVALAIGAGYVAYKGYEWMTTK